MLQPTAPELGRWQNDRLGVVHRPRGPFPAQAAYSYHRTRRRRRHTPVSVDGPAVKWPLRVMQAG